MLGGFWKTFLTMAFLVSVVSGLFLLGTVVYGFHGAFQVFFKRLPKPKFLCFFFWGGGVFFGYVFF